MNRLILIVGVRICSEAISSRVSTQLYRQMRYFGKQPDLDVHYSRPHFPWHQPYYRLTRYGQIQMTTMIIFPRKQDLTFHAKFARHVVSNFLGKIRQLFQILFAEIFTKYAKRYIKYSGLSLSRPRLSRITAYLKMKIWSRFNIEI